MNRKILYSPGFGAGWTTWESDADVKKLMLTYQPIIDALERGEMFKDDWKVTRHLHSENTAEREAAEAQLHPAMQQLLHDVRAMGKETPYLGGMDQLRVLMVSGPVRINEYDGNENVEEQGEYQEWL